MRPPIQRPDEPEAGDSQRTCSRPSVCRHLDRWLAGSLALFLVGLVPTPAAPLRTVVIGDSLSAEYDSLTGVSGVDDPTEYAAITANGWESRCWVEVLGALRAGELDFGAYRTTLPGWNDLRFTGYQYNFAIPGFTAAQYEDIVNCSILSNPQYLPYRLTLEGILKNEADVVVVWIGANEFRANYGSLYDGTDPTPLVSHLRHDIGEILDFVIAQKSGLKLVVANLPDLGASPAKQTAHPDPTKRPRVTAATESANQAIRELAAARNLPVADVFSATRRLIEGQTNWLGAVSLHPGSHPDNNPRYEFTRDGLHPNTALQIEIAGTILAAVNERYATAIPSIRDFEALALLGINPQQPYLDWAADRGVAPGGMGEDPDGDGLVNLAEYAFNMNPTAKDRLPVTLDTQASPPQARYAPVTERLPLVNLVPQWSADLKTWSNVPASNLSTNAHGETTLRFPSSETGWFLRLQIGLKSQ